MKHGIAKSGVGEEENSPGEKAFPRIYTGPNRQGSPVLAGNSEHKNKGY